MIKTVAGNILDSTEDCICQQVNCHGVMGAGVAKAIAEKWPLVKSLYTWKCRQQFNLGELLGYVQSINIGDDRFVLNIFGQLDYGRDKYKRYTDYSALTKAFDTIRTKYNGYSLAFPYGFGCGLANGDWKIVSQMIDTYFKDFDVTIYKLEV
jgi:O-acetyl-ADP-ribose deacetylase (regulator of RNase III)